MKRVVKVLVVAVAALAIVDPGASRAAQARACRQPAPVVRVADAGFDWSSAAIGAAAAAALVLGLGSSAVLVRTKETEGEAT